MFGRHGRDAQDQGADGRQFLDPVHTARLHGGPWHAVVLGRPWLLRHRDATGGLDGPHAQRAVGARARQDDADAALAGFFGDRLEQAVHRRFGPRVAAGRCQVQHRALQRHVLIGGRDVDASRAERRIVLGIAHLQIGVRTQQLGQHAGMRWRQVLGHNVGRMGLGRQGRGNLPQRLQPTSRGANPHHQQGLVPRVVGCRVGVAHGLILLGIPRAVAKCLFGRSWTGRRAAGPSPVRAQRARLSCTRCLIERHDRTLGVQETTPCHHPFCHGCGPRACVHCF